jgi:uncharacterized protein (TIRG00374 family)
VEDLVVTAQPRLDEVSGLPRVRRGPTAWLKPIIGIAISAFFIWLALRNLSLHDIGTALAGADWRLVALALPCLAIGYTARITRWWVMLRPSAPDLRWTSAASPFLISIAANNVLPLRIGDVLRLFAFRGRPGLEAGRVGGTLLVERLLDLFVLLAIFALVLPYVPASADNARIVTAATWAALAGAVALLGLVLLPAIERLVLSRIAQIPAVRGSALAGKLLGIVSALVDTLVRLGRPSRIAALILLSLAAWLFEGGVFVAAAGAAGVPLSLQGSFFALAVATLSTLLPSSPGYVGTFHFFGMQAAMAFGAAQPNAAAFAIIAHLMLWLPTTAAGLIAFTWSTLRQQARPADGFSAPPARP